MSFATTSVLCGLGEKRYVWLYFVIVAQIAKLALTIRIALVGQLGQSGQQ